MEEVEGVEGGGMGVEACGGCAIKWRVWRGVKGVEGCGLGPG